MSRPPPSPPTTFVSPPQQRFRRGKGRRYVPDVVEKVRVLIEGTTWSEAAIAARIGVGLTTVHAWKVRRGWRRPPNASVSTRKVGLSRAGFTRRCREALRQIEEAAAGEVLRLRRDQEIDRTVLARAVALVREAQNGRRPARTRPPCVTP